MTYLYIYRARNFDYYYVFVISLCVIASLFLQQYLLCTKYFLYVNSPSVLDASTLFALTIILEIYEILIFIGLGQKIVIHLSNCTFLYLNDTHYPKLQRFVYHSLVLILV